MDVVHIIRQINFLVFSMNKLLKMVFHLSENRNHLRTDAEIHHKLRQRRLSQKASVLLVKIVQHAVTDKAYRNREEEHPLVVEAARAVLRHHDILEQAVHVGSIKRLIRLQFSALSRTRSKHGDKFIRPLKRF